MREARADILIVGAGLGGVAGVLAALKLGKRVILTEEKLDRRATDIPGGPARRAPLDRVPRLYGLVSRVPGARPPLVSTQQPASARSSPQPPAIIT
jgi:glycine/D-amino acid oxidase-like deaminating enzyme